jgi:beta-fructofuranosidase
MLESDAAAVQDKAAQDRAVDRARPRLHVHPEHGWLNDPNGLCRIDGTYHVFFQFNPDEPRHGNIHWGHASSPDLLRWSPEPVALSPTPGGPDPGGCWSGCIVDENGVPTAVYTAVKTSAQDAGVNLARSDRTLREWAVDPEWRIDTPEDPEISDVRDPFVFHHDGHRYALQGGGHNLGEPQVLLYGCDDLDTWSYLGPLLTSADPVAAAVAAANIWECPNLFRLGEDWVLLLSLWRNHQLSGVRYLLGDLVRTGDGLRFVTRSGGTLDTGPAFYAPQVLVEPDRVLLWGWSWEGPERSDEAIHDAGWAGTLTYPREVVLSGGGVVLRPARELTGLRRDVLSCAPGARIDAPSFEIVASRRIHLRLIDPVSDSESVVAQSDAPVRVLVDGSLIEVFGPGSSYTTRAYPTTSSHWLVDTEGPVEIWSLGVPH